MAGNSRRVFKAISEQLNKSPMLNNATTAIGNATDIAQEKISNLQTLASEKYVNIVKHVNGATIIQDLNAAALQPSKPLPTSLVKWWHWYQQLTGMDKIETAKHQVIVVQDKLFKCQEERRDLTRNVVLVNEKLKEIYGELIQTKRDDEKYVQLTIMENKGLREQSRIHNELSILEKEERDHFTHLATAIKEYHDSQTINAQKYKYLSIVASAMLAVVSLTGSMIYNNRRIVDVRNVISSAQQSLESNLNQKFAIIVKKIDTQDQSIAEAALAVPKFMSNLTPSMNKDKVADDDFKEMEKLKQAGYYLGITILAMYALQLIFRG